MERSIKRYVDSLKRKLRRTRPVRTDEAVASPPEYHHNYWPEPIPGVWAGGISEPHSD